MERTLIDGWLEGLAYEMGVTFAGADTEATRPHRKYAYYKDQVGLKGITSAKKWLKKGHGVAILLDPAKRLWVLDADSPADTKRVLGILQVAGITPPMVRTPRGMHFYFLLPETFPIYGLKSHWCHRTGISGPRDSKGNLLDLDFKFGPRSWVFAPGTIKKGKAPYTPMMPWRTPPVVDPAIFCSNPNFYHPTRQLKTVYRLKPGYTGPGMRANDVSLSEERKPFLVSQRTFADRQIRGRNYIRSKDLIAISGRRGRLTLAAVLSHLIVYLRLDPSCVFEMLTYGVDSWNSRCKDRDGNPYPWSEKELWDAIELAKDSVPAQGVRDWIKEQRQLKLVAMVEVLKGATCIPCSNRVSVQKVRKLFGWFGIPNLSSKSLGDALTDQGVGRIQHTRSRTLSIQSLDLLAMKKGLLEAARKSQVEERGFSGCPLIKGALEMQRAS